MNLNQITVPSSDVSKSIEFYRRIGLKLIVVDLPKYARFECPDGDATFSVERQSIATSESGIVVYFECADLGSAVREARERGVQFDGEPLDQPWLWREAHLRDPDGNRICLFTAGDNRKYPPWRVSE